MTDPETQAAIADVLRIMAEARQAGARRYVCARCRRTFPLERLAAVTPALCQDCQRRQQEQQP